MLIRRRGIKRGAVRHLKGPFPWMHISIFLNYKHTWIILLIQAALLIGIYLSGTKKEVCLSNKENNRFLNWRALIAVLPRKATTNLLIRIPQTGVRNYSSNCLKINKLIKRSIFPFQVIKINRRIDGRLKMRKKE